VAQGEGSEFKPQDHKKKKKEKEKKRRLKIIKRHCVFFLLVEYASLTKGQFLM
jgi:hypothetical protein